MQMEIIGGAQEPFCLFPLRDAAAGQECCREVVVGFELSARYVIKRFVEREHVQGIVSGIVESYAMTMNDCIFCKIAAGEVPSRKVHHEDNTIVSFLDINQDVPGHTLVIPMEHHTWFYELPDEVANKLFRAARHIAKDLKEQTKADFIELSIIGVDVPHVHIHLFPRFFKNKTAA
jgi:histidine triad (HIT) family protein